MASFGYGRRRSPLGALSLLQGRGMGGRAQVFEGLMLLNLLKEVAEMPWRPPVTLGLMALNAGSHLAKGRLLPLLGAWTVSSCGFDGQRVSLLLRVLTVAARGQSRRLRWGSVRGIGVTWLVARELVRRVLASQVMHVDATHLIYNMTSLLWKGAELEARLGLPALVRLVAFSLLTGPMFSLAVSMGLARLGWTRSLRATTVGFSGVLFSLKVVANDDASRRTVLPFVGVVVPSRWATWVELVLIQLLVPGTSFVGHLGGILSGLAYLCLQRVGAGRFRSRSQRQQPRSARARRRQRPGSSAGVASVLQSVLRTAAHMQRQCEQLIRSLVQPSSRQRQGRPRFHGSGTTGARRPPPQQQQQGQGVPVDVD